MNNIARNLLTYAIIGGFTVITSACAQDVENKGYVSKFSDFSKVKAGATKYEVIEALGTPTTTSMFGDETWFYIGKEQTKETFFRPDVKSYDGYEIVFSGDVVKSVNKNDRTALREIELAEEETRTSGNEITVWQQLFGNLGKFNPASKTGGGAVETGVTPGSRGPRNY